MHRKLSWVLATTTITKSHQQNREKYYGESQFVFFLCVLFHANAFCSEIFFIHSLCVLWIKSLKLVFHCSLTLLPSQKKSEETSHKKSFDRRRKKTMICITWKIYVVSSSKNYNCYIQTGHRIQITQVNQFSKEMNEEEVKFLRRVLFLFVSLSIAFNWHLGDNNKIQLDNKKKNVEWILIGMVMHQYFRWFVHFPPRNQNRVRSNCVCVCLCVYN